MRNAFGFRITLPAMSAPPVWKNWPQVFVRISTSVCSRPALKFNCPSRTSMYALCAALVTYKLPPATFTTPTPPVGQLPRTRFENNVADPPSKLSVPCASIGGTVFVEKYRPNSIEFPIQLPFEMVMTPSPHVPTNSGEFVATSCPPVIHTTPVAPIP